MANVNTSDLSHRGAALTPRQRQILALVASGLSSPDVAEELGISPGTVKTHLTTIYKVIRVRNRVQATRFYLDHIASRSETSR